MSFKIPFEIPRFEGKEGEDPWNHIMSFHIWLSSYNIVDDSISFLMFHITLIGVIAEWYIDRPNGKHPNFMTLASNFLQLLWFLFHYNEGV